mmetsp:Transcript_62446/g.190964  ORF Transcript_62446/g.190964 Transcript_62446/m.190964 type:complete len:220 (-) Transcript_62446:1690-2349(-)
MHVKPNRSALQGGIRPDGYTPGPAPAATTSIDLCNARALHVGLRHQIDDLGGIFPLHDAQHKSCDDGDAWPEIVLGGHLRPQDRGHLSRLLREPPRHRLGVLAVRRVLQHLRHGEADRVRVRVEFVDLHTGPQMSTNRSGPLVLVHEERVADHGHAARHGLYRAVGPAMRDETPHAVAPEDVLLRHEALDAPTLKRKALRQPRVHVLGQRPQDPPRALV